MEERTRYITHITTSQEWKLAVDFDDLDPTNPGEIVTGRELLAIAAGESRFAKRIGASQQKMAQEVAARIVELRRIKDPRADAEITQLRERYHVGGSGTYAGGALCILQAFGVIDKLL